MTPPFESAGPVSRRAFLAASGGLLTAATVGSALGWPETAGAARNKALSALVLSSDLYASPSPQRFVFGTAKGARFNAGPAAQVGFVPPGVTGEVTVEKLDATLHKAGLPKGRGVYGVEAVFDVPGNWQAFAFIEGKRVPFAIQVKERPEAPIVGAAAPRAPSPTKTDRLGVKPICTRRPQCPLHTVSLSEVIGAGTPVAVLFATPALCQSAYCGPVLDELLDTMLPYEGRVTFVHVEIYTSNRGATLSPTVDAWGLPSEPWLFTIDGAGTIRGRLDGAFGGDEITKHLDSLVQ